MHDVDRIFFRFEAFCLLLGLNNIITINIYLREHIIYKASFYPFTFNRFLLLKKMRFGLTFLCLVATVMIGGTFAEMPRRPLPSNDPRRQPTLQQD